MKSAGVDAYIAASTNSLVYLHSLNEHGGERLLMLAINGDEGERLICPALTETQAKRVGIADVRTWNDGEDPGGLVADLASDWDVRHGTIAIDDDLRASHLLLLQKAMPGATFIPGHPVLSRVTSVKDEEELKCLFEAGRIADEAFVQVLPRLKPGLTEFDVSKMLADAMTAGGGIPTFAIVGAGANGAEPHHHTDNTMIKDGDVIVMDFGCDYGGYQSDITRMAAVGEPDPEAKRVYRVVLEAHKAARNLIREGVTYEELDRTARGVIDGAGYGEFFTHRLGHGLGMSIHESPNVIEGNSDPVKVGHCFSIEPGVYLPGRFGIRIENIVTAQLNSHMSFNSEPPEELPVID
jgi:Xaa-Pro aminopeptidase